MDWDRLRIFHAVAEAGSFTHAGEQLSLSQSAVSRQISTLEESLSLALFHRHARGLILTEQGDTLYAATKEIAAKLSLTEAMLREGKETAKGTLRLTTTVTFGTLWLAPRLNIFLERYPDIRLIVQIHDGIVDLSMRQADVAVRLGKPHQSDLIQRHLITFHFHLYAAPSYIEHYGAPKTLEDLRQHRLVTYGNHAELPFAEANWLLDHLGKDAAELPVLKINNYQAIFSAIKAGVGIGVLPTYMQPEAAKLVKVLDAVEPPPVPAYFVYPEELRNSKRIAVLRDFLLENIAGTQF